MYIGLWLPFLDTLAHCYTPIVHLDPLLTPIKGRSRALVREGWPRGRTGWRTVSLSLSPSRTLVTPLLQAHPTWAQGNTKAAGFPFACFFPPSCSASRQPIWAGSRSDNSLVGPGTPRGRNADTSDEVVEVATVVASILRPATPPVLAVLVEPLEPASHKHPLLIPKALHLLLCDRQQRR